MDDNGCLKSSWQRAWQKEVSEQDRRHGSLTAHNQVTNGLILSIYRFDYRSYDTDMQVDSLELFTYFIL